MDGDMVLSGGESAVSVAGSLQIQTVDDLSRIAKMMAASGYFQDSKDVAQAGVKIMAGLELGFPAFASMTGISIIKGKPVMGANLMAAAIKRSGKYTYRVRNHTAENCTIEFFERMNEWESIGIAEFSIEDAKAAGLSGNDNWRKYPKNMLFARTISNGVKFFCPDIFLGSPVYTPDELGLKVDDSGEAIEVAVTTVSSTVPTLKKTDPKKPSNSEALSSLLDRHNITEASVRQAIAAKFLDGKKADAYSSQEFEEILSAAEFALSEDTKTDAA
jgi:hypothetical protein